MRESAKARAAWADFLALGSKRSLQKLHGLYRDRSQTAPEAPPTRWLETLKDWSVAFGWQARLAAIADEAARALQEAERAYRRAILESGYAVAVERVKGLKDLAEALWRDLGMGDTLDTSMPRFWLEDRKVIGRGAHSQEVVVLRFNAAEIEQWRGVLRDIAAEVGERTQRAGRAPEASSSASVIICLPDNER